MFSMCFHYPHSAHSCHFYPDLVQFGIHDVEKVEACVAQTADGHLVVRHHGLKPWKGRLDNFYWERSFANRLNQHRFKPTREFTNANSPCISTSPKWPLWTFQNIELKVRRSDVLHWIPHLGWWILTFRGFSNQFRQIIVKSNFVGS